MAIPFIRALRPLLGLAGIGGTGQGGIPLAPSKVALSQLVGEVEKLDGALNGVNKKIGQSIPEFAKFATTLLTVRGVYSLLVEQIEAFNSSSIRAQSSFLVLNDLFDDQGKPIQNFTEKFASVRPVFEDTLKQLQRDTRILAGVTSRETSEVFSVVLNNLGNIEGQSQKFTSSLQSARELTTSLTAALGTLQLPLQQANQEIRDLLQGNLKDPNALVARTLRIDKGEFELARSQGRLVDFLLKRLEALKEGNKLLVDSSISAVADNIKDTIEVIGRETGKPLFNGIVSQLKELDTFLDKNREVIQNTLKGAVEFIARVFNAVIPGIKLAISGISSAFADTAKIIELNSQIITDSIGNINLAIGGLVGGLALVIGKLAQLADYTLLRPFRELQDALSFFSGRRASAQADFFEIFGRPLKDTNEEFEAKGKRVVEIQTQVKGGNQLSEEEEKQFEEEKERLGELIKIRKNLQEGAKKEANSVFFGQTRESTLNRLGEYEKQTEDLVKRLQEVGIETEKLNSRPIEIVDRGGFAKVALEDYKAALRDFRKSSNEDPGQLAKTTKEIISRSQAVVDLGVVTREEAAKNLEVIIANGKVEFDVRQSAQESLFKLLEDGVKRRKELLQLETEANKAAVEKGVRTKAEAAVKEEEISKKSLEAERESILQKLDAQRKLGRPSQTSADVSDIEKRIEAERSKILSSNEGKILTREFDFIGDNISQISQQPLFEISPESKKLVSELLEKKNSIGQKLLDSAGAGSQIAELEKQKAEIQSAAGGFFLESPELKELESQLEATNKKIEASTAKIASNRISFALEESRFLAETSSALIDQRKAFDQLDVSIANSGKSQEDLGNQFAELESVQRKLIIEQKRFQDLAALPVPPTIEQRRQLDKDREDSLTQIATLTKQINDQEQSVASARIRSAEALFDLENRLIKGQQDLAAAERKANLSSSEAQQNLIDQQAERSVQLQNILELQAKADLFNSIVPQGLDPDEEKEFEVRRLKTNEDLLVARRNLANQDRQNANQRISDLRRELQLEVELVEATERRRTAGERQAVSGALQRGVEKASATAAADQKDIAASLSRARAEAQNLQDILNSPQLLKNLSQQQISSLRKEAVAAQTTVTDLLTKQNEAAVSGAKTVLDAKDAELKTQSEILKFSRESSEAQDTSALNINNLLEDRRVLQQQIANFESKGPEAFATIEEFEQRRLELNKQDLELGRQINKERIDGLTVQNELELERRSILEEGSDASVEREVKLGQAFAKRAALQARLVVLDKLGPKAFRSLQDFQKAQNAVFKEFFENEKSILGLTADIARIADEVAFSTALTDASLLRTRLEGILEISEQIDKTISSAKGLKDAIQELDIARQEATASFGSIRVAELERAEALLEKVTNKDTPSGEREEIKRQLEQAGLSGKSLVEIAQERLLIEQRIAQTQLDVAKKRAEADRRSFELEQKRLAIELQLQRIAGEQAAIDAQFALRKAELNRKAIEGDRTLTDPDRKLKLEQNSLEIAEAKTRIQTTGASLLAIAQLQQDQAQKSIVDSQRVQIQQQTALNQQVAEEQIRAKDRRLELGRLGVNTDQIKIPTTITAPGMNIEPLASRLDQLIAVNNGVLAQLSSVGAILANQRGTPAVPATVNVTNNYPDISTNRQLYRKLGI